MLKNEDCSAQKERHYGIAKVLILLSIQLPPSIVTVHHVVGISHMLLAPSSHFFSRHSRHCSLA